MSLKMIIADDDALIRESLKIIFQMDDRFHVIGVVTNGQEAYELCLNEPVDVALLDVRMPILNGVEATAKIISETRTRVMILTTFDEDDYIRAAFKNGASGYLLKNSPPEQIKTALLSVKGGNVVIQDVVMDQFKDPKPSVDLDEKLSILTLREKEVTELISKGLTNGEIAKKLFISEGTVKNTVSHILSKLELKHRTQIAIFYLTD